MRVPAQRAVYSTWYATRAGPRKATSQSPSSDACSVTSWCEMDDVHRHVDNTSLRELHDSAQPMIGDGLAACMCERCRESSPGSSSRSCRDVLPPCTKCALNRRRALVRPRRAPGPRERRLVKRDASHHVSVLQRCDPTRYYLAKESGLIGVSFQVG